MSDAAVEALQESLILKRKYIERAREDQERLRSALEKKCREVTDLVSDCVKIEEALVTLGVKDASRS